MKYHKIDLYVGDEGHDGHGIFNTIQIRSSVDHFKLEEAFKKGTKKVGFDLREEVGHKYLESWDDKKKPDPSELKEEHIKILQKHGVKLEQISEALEYDLDPKTLYRDEHSRGARVSCPPEGYAKLWMMIAKIGNPDLEYSFLKKNDSINIGGYCLFNC